MFKNYKRKYNAERNLKEYYQAMLSTATRQIDYYKEQIEYYETTCKKMKRLSNIGLWCGIASLLFVTVSMILKAVL